jgi:hypothetical protein
VKRQAKLDKSRWDKLLKQIEAEALLGRGDLDLDGEELSKGVVNMLTENGFTYYSFAGVVTRSRYTSVAWRQK